MKISKLLLSVILLSLIGCSTGVPKLQSSVDRVKGELDDVRSIQAEQLTNIEDLRSQIQELRGRLDRVEFSSRPSNPQVSMGGDIPVVSPDGGTRVRKPTPAIVPVDLLGEDEDEASTLSAEVGPRFLEGLQLTREGEFSQARSVFEEVLDLIHSEPQAARVIFWLGISAEGLNENARAIKHYAELVTRFPKSIRVPSALYRQASVLIRLGDKVAAGAVFRKLIADYPKSVDAANAKKRLKDI